MNGPKYLSQALWDDGAARGAAAPKPHGVKEDEIEFYRLLWRLDHSAARVSARDILNAPDAPIAFKRGVYCLLKYAARGWYSYGVTLDLGIMTAKAPNPEQFEQWARGGGGWALLGYRA